MTNAEFFQTVIDQTGAHIGVDTDASPTTGLWHLLACALDWCELNGIDLAPELADVQDTLLQERSDR